MGSEIIGRVGTEIIAFRHRVHRLAPTSSAVIHSP